MFFIRCAVQDLGGKSIYHRQKVLIFFQALCRQTLLLKFYLLTVTDTPANTSLTETFD